MKNGHRKPKLVFRSNLPAVVRWCRYGRWTRDGKVVNAQGRVIYPHTGSYYEQADLI
jgi:hypothetical protein